MKPTKKLVVVLFFLFCFPLKALAADVTHVLLMSDETHLLFSYNKDTKELFLTSLDPLLVTATKPQEGMKQLEQSLSTPIPYYAAATPATLEQLVDALGGINVQTKTLMGKEAVAYLRKGSEAQRQVVAQMGKKIKTLNKLSLLSMIYKFLPQVQTNIPTGEVINLGTQIAFGPTKKLVELDLHATPASIKKWRQAVYH